MRGAFRRERCDNPKGGRQEILNRLGLSLFFCLLLRIENLQQPAYGLIFLGFSSQGGMIFDLVSHPSSFLFLFDISGILEFRNNPSNGPFGNTNFQSQLVAGYHRIAGNNTKNNCMVRYKSPLRHQRPPNFIRQTPGTIRANAR